MENWTNFSGSSDEKLDTDWPKLWKNAMKSDCYSNKYAGSGQWLKRVKMTNDFGAPINDQDSELATNKDEFPLLTNVGGDILLFKP